MNEITTIGLDLAKHVFQVHGVNTTGKTMLHRTLKRSQVRRFFAQCPPCLVGIEACGGMHYWVRELTALGHEVRVMTWTGSDQHNPLIMQDKGMIKRLF